MIPKKGATPVFSNKHEIIVQLSSNQMSDRSCQTGGSKHEERAGFRVTSEQSARRASSSAIDSLRTCSPSGFFHQHLVNWHVWEVYGKAEPLRLLIRSGRRVPLLLCKSQDFAGENSIILRAILFHLPVCSAPHHPRYLYRFLPQSPGIYKIMLIARGLMRTLCGGWIKLCVGRASAADQSEPVHTSAFSGILSV